MTDDVPPLGTNISPQKWHFEDDFPFPKVGYVNSLEGISCVCFSQVQSELLSTALAIAALRRCFGPTSALVVTWINRLFQIRGRRGKFVCILYTRFMFHELCII